MRNAMANANLGDDVYGEDPTVNLLQQVTADKLGFEAGLFVASGTMGNFVSLLAHATRGDEIILGHDCHVMLWEAGNIAALGGITPRTLPTDGRGKMDVASVEASVRWDNPHLPRSRAISVENSYGNKNGYPIEVDYFEQLREVANRHDLLMHMDGARFFNAVTALKIKPQAITQHLDSITVCLSKGLCAPVGSVVCGSKEFIDKAARIRKSIGGGMRQAGVLAAAGLISINEMSERLDEDHVNAKYLATKLSKIEGIKVNCDEILTNIVYFSLDGSVNITTDAFTTALREEHAIWLGSSGVYDLRAVIHYWVGKPEIDKLVSAIEIVLETN